MSAIRMSLLKAYGHHHRTEVVTLAKPQQDQLRAAENPSRATHIATLNNLKTLLNQQYSPKTVDRVMCHIFKKGSMAAVEGHVAKAGIKGAEIYRLVNQLYKVRKAVVLSDLSTHGKEFQQMMRNEIMEDVAWPASLDKRERGLVADKAMEVINEFAQINGKNADQFKVFLGGQFAQTAAALKEKGDGGSFIKALDSQVAGLIKIMDQSAAKAAVNNENMIGDLARSMAPKLSDERHDFATNERQIRLGMLQNMVERMGHTSVKVNLDTGPQAVSLARIFAHQNPEWPNLSAADRLIVVKAFMTLHAETHAYPDVVTLRPNTKEDAAGFLRSGPTHVLELSTRTLASDDTRHVLKNLTHELTHTYQNTLISQQNTRRAEIPPQVVKRYDFDAKARPFTRLDYRVKNFADQQNNYVRNYMERAAVESEYAVLELTAPKPPPLAQLVKDTANLQKGGAGRIRTQEWDRSLQTHQQLAQTTEDDTKRANYLAEGASIALELARVDGRNYLETAATMLSDIDFSKLSRPDKARISQLLVDSLIEMLGRRRSGEEEKQFAKSHLPKFQIALVQATQNPNVRKKTYDVADKLLTARIKQSKDSSVTVDLHRNRAELRSLKNDTPSVVLKDVLREAGKMFKLANESGNPNLLTKTIAMMKDLETLAQSIPVNDEKERTQIGRVKAGYQALEKQLKPH